VRYDFGLGGHRPPVQNVVKLNTAYRDGMAGRTRFALSTPCKRGRATVLRYLCGGGNNVLGLPQTSGNSHRKSQHKERFKNPKGRPQIFEANYVGPLRYRSTALMTRGPGGGFLWEGGVGVCGVGEGGGGWSGGLWVSGQEASCCGPARLKGPDQLTGLPGRPRPAHARPWGLAGQPARPGRR
jgi:hypothetical protein